MNEEPHAPERRAGGGAGTGHLRAPAGRPRRELAWRLHFTMGALAYTLAGADAWRLIAALNPVETDNDERLLRRLAPFLIAGLKAPLREFDDQKPVHAAQQSPPFATTRPSVGTA